MEEEYEEKIQPMRLGNVEFRMAKSLGRNPHDYVDIVLWYPNAYYGREGEFEWSGEWATPKDRPNSYRVHESCFKNPESCYTVATIDIREEPDVHSVGLRAFELGPKDYADFLAIVKQAYRYAHQTWSDAQNY